MAQKRRRVYGSKLDFRSLSSAPTTELGVVYLFGVLHDRFDFKIESIQPGFPDCIARKQISKNKWEELRIEFEYKSKSFRDHKHDPAKVDIIICWEDNWPDHPEGVEVIELSSIIKVLEGIPVRGKKPKIRSAWNKFAREKRLEGYSFTEIAKMWDKKKSGQKKTKKVSEKQQPTEYQKFCSEKRKEGYSFKKIAELWRKEKDKKSSKKKPTGYQKFLKEKIAEGKTFKEAGKLWQEKKQKSKL
jgi:hypothetical protein